eukprot:25326_1
MGKRKRKLKKLIAGCDFKKLKKKVGKKLAPANETRTSFKSQAISLSKQIQSKSGKLVNERNLTFPELLSQTRHFNARVRHSALMGLKDLFTRHPQAIASQAASAIETVSECLVDNDGMVRTALLTLFNFLLPKIESGVMEESSKVLMPYIFAAMAHLSLGIRAQSVVFLKLVLDLYPNVAWRFHAEALPNLSKMIADRVAFSKTGSGFTSSHKRSQEKCEKQTKLALQCLAGYLDLYKPEENSMSLEVAENEDSEPETVQKPSDSQEPPSASPTEPLETSPGPASDELFISCELPKEPTLTLKRKWKPEFRNARSTKRMRKTFTQPVVEDEGRICFEDIWAGKKTGHETEKKFSFSEFFTTALPIIRDCFLEADPVQVSESSLPVMQATVRVYQEAVQIMHCHSDGNLRQTGEDFGKFVFVHFPLKSRSSREAPPVRAMNIRLCETFALIMRDCNVQEEWLTRMLVFIGGLFEKLDENVDMRSVLHVVTLALPHLDTQRKVLLVSAFAAAFTRMHWQSRTRLEGVKFIRALLESSDGKQWLECEFAKKWFTDIPSCLWRFDANKNVENVDAILRFLDLCGKNFSDILDFDQVQPSLAQFFFTSSTESDTPASSLFSQLPSSTQSLGLSLLTHITRFTQPLTRALANLCRCANERVGTESRVSVVKAVHAVRSKMKLESYISFLLSIALVVPPHSADADKKSSRQRISKVLDSICECLEDLNLGPVLMRLVSPALTVRITQLSQSLTPPNASFEDISASLSALRCVLCCLRELKKQDESPVASIPENLTPALHALLWSLLCCSDDSEDFSLCGEVWIEWPLGMDALFDKLDADLTERSSSFSVSTLTKFIAIDRIKDTLAGRYKDRLINVVKKIQATSGVGSLSQLSRLCSDIELLVGSGALK